MVTIPTPSMGKKPAMPPPPGPSSQSLAALERRLKVLEQGHSNVRKILQVTEENVLVKNKHVSQEFKTLTADINEVRRDIQDIKERMLLIIKELKTSARKDEVKVIERYVNMWDPLKFVTRGEVEDIIKEVLVEQTKEKKQ